MCIVAGGGEEREINHISGIGKSGFPEESIGIGIISANRGDFTFQSADDVIKFIRITAQGNNDIWIRGEQQYPCMAVCINGEYAAINFFKITQVECGCHIMIKIKKKLLLLQKGRNGSLMSMQLLR